MHVTIEVDIDNDDYRDPGVICNALADATVRLLGVTRVKVYGPLAGRIDLHAERFSEDLDNEGSA